MEIEWSSYIKCRVLIHCIIKCSCIVINVHKQWIALLSPRPPLAVLHSAIRHLYLDFSIIPWSSQIPATALHHYDWQRKVTVCPSHPENTPNRVGLAPVCDSSESCTDWLSKVQSILTCFIRNRLQRCLTWKRIFFWLSEEMSLFKWKWRVHGGASCCADSPDFTIEH